MPVEVADTRASRRQGLLGREGIEGALLLRPAMAVHTIAMRFAIGPEDALYLVGQMPLSAVDEEELDRIVGSTYAAVEQWFRAAMRIGFAGRFHG